MVENIHERIQALSSYLSPLFCYLEVFLLFFFLVSIWFPFHVCRSLRNTAVAGLRVIDQSRRLVFFYYHHRNYKKKKETTTMTEKSVIAERAHTPMSAFEFLDRFFLPLDVFVFSSSNELQCLRTIFLGWPPSQFHHIIFEFSLEKQRISLFVSAENRY